MDKSIRSTKRYVRRIYSIRICFWDCRGRSQIAAICIAYLQKLCGHPLLVEEEYEDSIENFDEHDQNLLMEKSTKLKVMYNLVHTLITKGHRTLIFSQFTKVLDIIERVLEDKFRISRIDGKTKEKDRQRLVDEFNQPDSDVSIMLISTKAGGQGLTLTGADSCIVYDPSWNPAEDAQAVGKSFNLVALEYIRSLLPSCSSPYRLTSYIILYQIVVIVWVKKRESKSFD